MLVLIFTKVTKFKIFSFRNLFRKEKEQLKQAPIPAAVVLSEEQVNKHVSPRAAPRNISILILNKKLLF